MYSIKRMKTIGNHLADLDKLIQAEYDEMAARSGSEKQKKDVAEFIGHLKRYAGEMELTREICTELVTIDENNKGYKDRLRVIHVYYKLIDKPLTDKNRLALT